MSNFVKRTKLWDYIEPLAAFNGFLVCLAMIS